METPRNSDQYDISIHALHEESDSNAFSFRCIIVSFQSTLSMRRATANTMRHLFDPIFQSTLSMRRATNMMRLGGHVGVFQSTLSMRRATKHACMYSATVCHFNPRSP